MSEKHKPIRLDDLDLTPAQMKEIVEGARKFFALALDVSPGEEPEESEKPKD